MRKAFVLLSGGLDSTTCLFKAMADRQPNDQLPEAISINYGQRHLKETEYAAVTCRTMGISHSIIDASNLLNPPGTMLTDKSVAIPNIDYKDIEGVSPTYVPFRNGTLLSIITAHAQAWVNKMVREEDYCVPGQGIPGVECVEASIYFGAHSEDAANWAYPDCTPEFIGAMANAIYVGSYHAIRLHTPLQWLMKREIVELGDKLNVPFEMTWSCYAGEQMHCGTCPTCRSRKQAFIDAGVLDPTIYASDIPPPQAPLRGRTVTAPDDKIPL